MRFLENITYILLIFCLLRLGGVEWFHVLIPASVLMAFILFGVVVKVRLIKTGPTDPDLENVLR